jgi:rhodanese-related sulfurtransferase
VSDPTSERGRTADDVPSSGLKSRPVRDADLAEPFSRISPAEAYHLHQAGAQMVDVRPPGEYARLYIPGSVNIHVDDLFRRRGELKLDGPIVVVCRIGAVSALGAEILALLGCRQAHNLEGGIEEWARQGLPVETAAARNDQVPMTRSQ